MLGLANAGGDTVNSIKQAQGIRHQQAMKIAALLMFITDVHALGLDVAAGPEPDRELLLGPERPHPRLHQPGEAEDAEQLAEHDPRRLLFGDAALPEDHRRHGRGRGQEGRRRHRRPR